MSTELAKTQSSNIIRNMDDAERAARAMAGSGFFSDSKSANQAIVKILAGQELGFGPFASMVGVQIIKEKPVLGANLIATAIKRSMKYNYKILKHDENECTILFYELFNGKWDESGTSRFTIDDAKKAGVFETNANWKKYPRNQLFARAISNGQRWYAPDAFNGAVVYTPDEMGAMVDEDDNVIPATPTQSPQSAAPQLPAPQAKSKDTRQFTLQQRQALIDAGLAKDDFSAKGMLGLSCLTETSTPDEIVNWGDIYRPYREEEENGKKLHTATEAAEYANRMYTEIYAGGITLIPN